MGALFVVMRPAEGIEYQKVALELKSFSIPVLGIHVIYTVFYLNFCLRYCQLTVKHTLTTH